MKKKVSIIGAGFSGLSLAHECLQRGFEVEVYEARNGAGGMIMSPETSYGFYETAANSFLGTSLVEKFLLENGVRSVFANPQARKRFIFRQRPRKWPLTWGESLRLCLNVLKSLFKGSRWRKAQPAENIRHWGQRILGNSATAWILEPALQGVYAGDADQLSAEMIFAPKMKSRRLPMISGPKGMGRLMQDLQVSLEARGVQFFFERKLSGSDIEQIKNPVVLAVSVRAAAQLLSEMKDEVAQKNSQILKQAEVLPLISATAFFERPPQKYQGFGILFPRNEKIRALGVLMNSLIFERGFSSFTETWIFGGASDPHVLDLSDQEIEKMALEQSELVFGESLHLQELRITRWPEALPHSTTDWLKNLQQLQKMNKVTLHGNYLGSLGLSRILERSLQLAQNLESL